MGALRQPPNVRPERRRWRLPQSGGGIKTPSRLEGRRMHSDHQDVRPHRNKHVAERFEGLLGTLMIVAVVVLAIGMFYAIATGDSTPSWMR